MQKIIDRLIFCFQGSFVNNNNEFIAHRRANTYFILENCKDELDIKCKVLEWLSRGAYKQNPYLSESRNNRFHKFMLNGINEFLDTEFTEEDIEIIYTYLGNAVNHEKTIRFIESGYDMAVLKGGAEC